MMSAIEPAAPLPVSVVIPVYNRAELVGRAISSAQRQRPAPPMEILVVDDASSDDTATVAARTGARVITHETNRGSSSARNTAIANATQPWVAFLDSDDEWMADMLATLWPLRADHVIVGGGSLNCGTDEQRDRYNGPLGRRPLILSSPARLIYPENFVATSGTMIRRDVARQVGGFVEGQHGAEDLDLWVRMLAHGTGLIVPRPVVVYHLHDGQVTLDTDMMGSSHRETALRYVDHSWWRWRTLEMWEGAHSYDIMRAGLRTRQHVAAGRAAWDLLRSPVRLLGALGIVARRLRLFRRSGGIDRRGQPTVAVAGGASSLMRSVLRPPSRAIVASRPAGWMLRLAGVSEVRVRTRRRQTKVR